MRKTITRGILRVLPLALSLWLFWSIGDGLNNLGLLLLRLVGIDQPWTGSGVVLILLLLLVIGRRHSMTFARLLYCARLLIPPDAHDSQPEDPSAQPVKPAGDPRHRCHGCSGIQPAVVAVALDAR